MIRLLIVEDEPIIAKHLECVLQDLGYGITNSCRTSADALKSLKNDLPDIILCDIHLAGDPWDGVRLAQEIRSIYDLPIIFLTALTDATTIHRAAAVDPDAYLSKPFAERSLYAAIELAVFKFSQKKEHSKDQNEIIQDVENIPFFSGNFFIKDKKRLIKVNTEEILWIKADGAYTKLVTIDRHFFLSTNLGTLESKLKDLPFIRVHRSYLVNFKYIDTIEEDVIAINGERIPIGKSFREAFYKSLNQL
jgi:DNA-binding LytR/AlgR family response regulator